MVFNVGKIRTTMQQLGQKLTPDKIHQFGTKVWDTALTRGRKVSNTLGKLSDVRNKLFGSQAENGYYPHRTHYSRKSLWPLKPLWRGNPLRHAMRSNKLISGEKDTNSSMLQT